ncbi:hypothetical protein CVT25_015297 [Psilocybe cyanescens]|uniref:WSC domain-containing protein n=1 Tax=Psilocybe cyanescens TaxID=93625 RepID=A0A409WH19_PSICY|nr:hypothetical protein CVT25_015297 [Psilocybe cyanescens]
MFNLGRSKNINFSVRANEITVVERQFHSPGFSLVGCYTDSADARTLRARSFTDNAMTPGLCMQFCGNATTFPPNGYGFAVCDGVIQLSGSPADPSECNLSCEGDSFKQFSCGGTNRVTIFTNGAPSPKIPTAAAAFFGPLVDVPRSTEEQNPPWNYVGCYSHSAANRALQTKMDGVQGNVNGCPVLCTLNTFFPANDAHPFFSGITNGGECWCGTSIASAAQRLPDIACASLGCANSNDLACGGESAIMIYEGPQLIEGFDAGLCNLPLFELGISGPFQIQVVFNTSLTTETAPITMISLEHQLINTDGINLQNVTDFTLAGILSFCAVCPQPVMFNLSGIKLLPNLESIGSLRPVVTPPRGGEPNFVQISSAFENFGSYCIGESRFRPGELVLNPFFSLTPLPFSAPSDAIFDPNFPWVLCINQTLNSFLKPETPIQDVVYKPLTFQPGFNLTHCNAAELMIVL